MATCILLIENDANNLELMDCLLRASDYIPLKAMDGVAGLAMIKQTIPNLILCDIQLPLLDGLTIAKELKQDKKLCAIPLIAVTALAMIGDKEKILKAGFDGYIMKPITPETFVNEVEEFLSPKKQLPEDGV